MTIVAKVIRTAVTSSPPKEKRNHHFQITTLIALTSAHSTSPTQHV